MIFKPLQGRSCGIYWYILQTSDASEVAFNRHWNQLRLAPSLMAKKPNESERVIFYQNGAQVFYKSGEVLDDLRAETLDGAIIDEVRQQYPELWPQVIRPMLARHGGWCDFYSTPNGFDHFYDLFEFAKAHPEEWATFHAPSSESPWWTPAEIESARGSMTEDIFAQEILAEFRDVHAGKAYRSGGPWNYRNESPFCGGLIAPWLPVILGLDFNVGHMRWELGQEKAGAWYWFDEIAIDDTNTQECAKELVARIQGYRSLGILNPAQKVVLCGDATGNARKTSATESDYRIICNALTESKITWENRTPDCNPPVKDRVNTVNSKLRDANGEIKCYINSEKCPKLKHDLERVSWKPGAQSILDEGHDRALTHASDAIGYPIHTLSPIEGVHEEVGIMRVVRR